MKQCSVCKIEKQLDEFYTKSPYKGRKARHTSECKECASIRNNNYIDTTPGAKENRARRSKQYRLRHPDKVRYQIKNATLKKKYGISYEDFLRMLEEQNSKCAICSKEVKDEIRNHHNRAVIDHCHKTGRVRSILCHMCNSSIGLMREDKELIKKIITYLEYHDAKR